MIPTDIRNLITALLALSAAIACFGYALTDQRRRAKKPVYAVAGIGFLYWCVIYASGSAGANWYLLKTGWLGAIGYYLLIMAFLALIVTDWRRNDRG
jgi:hypothetical protein